ncbi:MAG: imm11 family protein [Holosporales bacterium]
MNYTKPMEMTAPNFYANKYFMDYKWRERKTKSLIFTEGVFLPCPDRRNGALKTSTDPKDYDLIFHSNSKPEEFLKYGMLHSNASSCFLLRQDLVEVLSAFCPDDFQAFPVMIVPENPKKVGEFENHDYFLINITHHLDVFDHEKCEFEYLSFNPASPYSVKRYVVRNVSCLQGHHMVREKTLLSHVFVSSELVALFTKLKVKGCHFRKDAEG